MGDADGRGASRAGGFNCRSGWSSRSSRSSDSWSTSTSGSGSRAGRSSFGSGKSARPWRSRDDGDRDPGLPARPRSLAGIPSATEPDPTRPGPSARRWQRAYPWYDSKNDAVKPDRLARDPEPPRASFASGLSARSSSFLGNLRSRSWGSWLALAALIGVLVWFWRIYEPSGGGLAGESSKGRGEPRRVEALPPGMRREFESSDPWDEALRRRDRGDLAGAWSACSPTNC